MKSFDELASVVEDDSSVVIKLRNGGLGILTYAGCDKDISEIIYEWFGLSKKIIFYIIFFNKIFTNLFCKNNINSHNTKCKNHA